MHKGDLVTIEFTAKEVSTGKVFETTSKDVAEKEGLPTQNKVLGPALVTVGKGEILSGLDEELLSMKVGEKKIITLPPEKAFGARDPELVKVIPIAEFKKHNVNPVPGTVVNANDVIGKVQSVSGGRVRVDFNLDLAGKTVEYDVKVVKQFTENKEKLDALTQKYFPGKNPPAVKTEGEHVHVSAGLKEMAPYQPSITRFVKAVLDATTYKKVVVSTEFKSGDFEHTHVHEDGTVHADDAH